MSAYLKELTKAVEVSHRCEASHVGTVRVKEEFGGQVVWHGDVEVFALSGHPKAVRCYAWGVPEENGKEGDLESTTVLDLPPVNSPVTAVRAAIASAHRR